jgi:hypothetical protein
MTGRVAAAAFRSERRRWRWPDLFRLGIGNACIAAVIRKGIPDEMPPFAKKHSAQDIASITTYLRTLR